MYSINFATDLTGRDNIPSTIIEPTFKRASRWDAVMLIDEADVILEK